MTEMINVTDGEDLAARAQRRLAKAERRNEKIRNRLKSLQFFEDQEYTDYKGEVRKLPKAKRGASDEPQIQMMIARRDRYESCLKSLPILQKSLELSQDPREQMELIKHIVAMETLADKHAAAIERTLNSMMFVDSKVNGSRSALLTRAATLAMKDRHHQDIVAIRRKENPEDMAEAELLRIISAEAT